MPQIKQIQVLPSSEATYGLDVEGSMWQYDGMQWIHLVHSPGMEPSDDDLTLADRVELAVDAYFGLVDALNALEGPDGLVSGSISVSEWEESLGLCNVNRPPTPEQVAELIRQNKETD